MTKKELFSFISEFNKLDAISSDTIIEGLSILPEKDHSLFMLLVNYKNGNDFKNKLKAGKI
ncbi:MAG: hypothetical protein E7376_00835 [Clostridiales bacterium]|nr:hypothetical protein [Clostridiales bacterium]